MAKYKQLSESIPMLAHGYAKTSVMTAYHVGGTSIDDATPSSDVQHLVARLQLKGLQTGGMHVWCRNIEIQLLQSDRGVREGIILVLLWHKHVPWAHAHGLDGCVSAAA